LDQAKLEVHFNVVRLFLSHSPSSIKITEVNTCDVDMDGDFAASCIHTSLNLLVNLTSCWSEFPAAWQIFQLLSKKFLPLLSIKSLHVSTRALIKTLKVQLDQLQLESKERKGSTVLPKEPISMLKLYDPEVEDE